MNMDRWNEVFETLQRNKLRTFLTALGVFWGVFMLVIMLGFGRGLETGTVGSLSGWAKNAVSFWPAHTTMAHAGHKPGRRIKFSMDDAEVVQGRLQGVRIVAPRITQGWGSTRTVTRGNKTEMFQVTGDVPEYRFLEPMDITDGRFLNPNDLADYRKVVVIGRMVKNALFREDEKPIGQTLKVNGVPVTIIGVFKSNQEGDRAEWFENRLYMPITTFARMTGRADGVDQFTVLFEDRINSEKAEAELRGLLKRRHDIHPEDGGGIDSWNREKDFRKFMGLFDGIAALSWAVGIMTLLAGVLGVSNILMISVAERTREIGIRKAIGARPSSILAQIVQEAMVLTGLAGGLGLVAGVGLLVVAKTIVQSMPSEGGPSFFAGPDLDLSKALLATLVLTVAGGLAGIAPARTALAVKPVEALAHD